MTSWRGFDKFSRLIRRAKNKSSILIRRGGGAAKIAIPYWRLGLVILNNKIKVIAFIDGFK